MIETRLILEEHKKGRLPDEMREGIKSEILGLLNETRRPRISDLTDFLCNSDYFSSPAAIRYHAVYEGSLAAHSLLVYREFQELTKRFGCDVPEESIRISALLHDACKINSYKKIEDENGKLYDRTNDFPLGHGEKSVYIVGKYISLTNQEALLIRWHMGEYDKNFKDYDDLFRRGYDEVLLLQCADRLIAGIYKL